MSEASGLRAEAGLLSQEQNFVSALTVAEEFELDDTASKRQQVIICDL
jgi:hypothetical protein